MYKIVRNLFPPYVAKFARQEANMFFEEARYHENNNLIPEDQNIWKKQKGCNFTGGFPPSIGEIVRTIEAIIGIKCNPSYSGLRLQEIEDGWPRLPWHQDGATVELEKGQKMGIAWVPLDPIDGTRPTLQISNVEDPSLTEHVRDKHFFLESDSEAVTATVLEGLKPGDVVLFSPLTLHRTYFTPDMTNPRISLDLRFFGPPAYTA